MHTHEVGGHPCACANIQQASLGPLGSLAEGHACAHLVSGLFLLSWGVGAVDVHAVRHLRMRVWGEPLLSVRQRLRARPNAHACHCSVEDPTVAHGGACAVTHLRAHCGQRSKRTARWVSRHPVTQARRMRSVPHEGLECVPRLHFTAPIRTYGPGNDSGAPNGPLRSDPEIPVLARLDMKTLYVENSRLSVVILQQPLPTAEFDSLQRN